MERCLRGEPAATLRCHPGTLLRRRNALRPIFPVRICISTELSWTFEQLGGGWTCCSWHGNEVNIRIFLHTTAATKTSLGWPPTNRLHLVDRQTAIIHDRIHKSRIRSHSRLSPGSFFSAF